MGWCSVKGVIGCQFQERWQNISNLVFFFQKKIEFWLVRSSHILLSWTLLQVDLPGP